MVGARCKTDILFLLLSVKKGSNIFVYPSMQEFMLHSKIELNKYKIT